MAWFGAGFVFLLLVFWGPTHALRTYWGVLLLGGVLLADIALNEGLDQLSTDRAAGEKRLNDAMNRYVEARDAASEAVYPSPFSYGRQSLLYVATDLPEPNQERVALNMGFAKGDVPGMEVRCTSGLYAYHFRDRDTALFAYDNVIYTLRRQ